MSCINVLLCYIYLCSVVALHTKRLVMNINERDEYLFLSYTCYGTSAICSRCKFRTVSVQ